MRGLESGSGLCKKIILRYGSRESGAPAWLSYHTAPQQIACRVGLPTKWSVRLRRAPVLARSQTLTTENAPSVAARGPDGIGLRYQLPDRSTVPRSTGSDRFGELVHAERKLVPVVGHRQEGGLPVRSRRKLGLLQTLRCMQPEFFCCGRHHRTYGSVADYVKTHSGVGSSRRLFAACRPLHAGAAPPMVVRCIRRRWGRS